MTFSFPGFPTRRPTTLLVVLLTLAWTLIAFPAHARSDDWQSDGKGFEDVVDPLTRHPEIQRLLAASDEEIERSLDIPFVLEHRVPIGNDRTLFVSETFTLGSWLRLPHRAVLLMAGSAFNGRHFSVPVDGYNITEIAARRNFFAFTVDFLGVGESFRPADGREATFEENIEAIEILLRYIHFFRFVPKVDLFGEGYGAAVATQVAADAKRVRSTVQSATVFRELVGGPLSDPTFLELLESAPDGYFFLPGESSLVFLIGTPPAVVDYVFATQGGFYPIPNFLVAANLPFYDPGVARVPGLVLGGTEDFVVGPNDNAELAAAYGENGAQLVIIDGAAHAPRLEAPEFASQLIELTFDFFDP